MNHPTVSNLCFVAWTFLLIACRNCAHSNDTFISDQQLRVVPADIHERGLLYPLRFTPNELIGENAAVRSGRALASLPAYKPSMDELQAFEYGRGKLNPPAELLEYPVFAMLSQAAKCDRADWGLPMIGLAQDKLLIPDIVKCRELARLLAAKSLVLQFKGQSTESIAADRELLALARHLSQAQIVGPTMVGLEAADLFLSVVSYRVQQSNSPNLYWPLTTLSQSLVDIEPSVRGELYALERTFPELSSIATTQGSVQYWNDRLEYFLTRIRTTKVIINLRKTDSRDTFSAMLQTYPQAKQRLARRGWNEEQLERMCASQLVLLDGFVQYHVDRDALEQHICLPIRDAFSALDKRADEMEERDNKGVDLVSFSTAYLGEIHWLYHRIAKIQSAMAILRTVEAIRAFAARNDLKLPSKLEDIDFVPLPLDPQTMKPVRYEVQGDRATLVSTSPYGFPERVFLSIQNDTAK